VGVALAALLAACSAPPLSSPPPGNSFASARKDAGLDDLYVSDDMRGDIILLKNQGYDPDGKITAGINGPFGVTLDDEGNLYVANRAGGNVTEYAPRVSQPSFTYSTGMTQPLSVAVDRQGDLYEGDRPIYTDSDVVNEYAQNSNTVVHSCAVSSLYGVAVDSAGDVFVTFNSKSQGGRVEEFKGGLAGCPGIELGVHVYSAGGIALDNKANLIIADGVGEKVVVSKPPYAKVNRSLGLHFGTPLFVSIDKANKRVYVSDETNYWQYLYVLDYATGKKIRRLGAGHGGIAIPMAAVDGPAAQQ
jgi:DNA-binding beta-propeller fold protein YncE